MKIIKNTGRERLKNTEKQTKEKIKEKTKETVECVCGAVVTKYKLKRHQETKKHRDYIKED